MPSIHKVNGSRFYQAHMREPVVDPSTGQVTWKQVKRSTGQSDQAKAMKAAVEMEEALRATVEAGCDKSQQLLSILKKATDLAVQGRLSEPKAREFLAELFVEANDRKLEFYTVKSWLEHWLERKQRTVGSAMFFVCRKTMEDFLSWLGERSSSRLELVDPSDVVGFIHDLQGSGGLAAKTCNIRKKALFNAFKHACQAGLLSRNPVEGIQDLPEDDSVTKEPFTPEELTALLRAADSDPEWKTAILVGAYTGLRLSNCVRIKWSDLSLEKGLISIVPVKQLRGTKRKKRLAIPIHPNLLAALCEVPSSDDPNAPLFPRLSKMKVGGKTGLDGEFRRLMDKAGIDRGVVRSRDQGHRKEVAKKSFHSLRHFANSWMAENGVSQELRRLLIGHTSDAINDIYTHLSDEALKKAIESLPSL